MTCCACMPAEGIRSTTNIQAEVAPPAPFSYLPKSVLITVGAAALHGALANLQVHSLCCAQHTPRGTSLQKADAIHAVTSNCCRC